MKLETAAVWPNEATVIKIRVNVPISFFMMIAVMGLQEGKFGKQMQNNYKTAYKLPLAACSRSIASNKALKFPLPKLLAPLRWIISKNKVGRSWIGFEKSCNR